MIDTIKQHIAEVERFSSNSKEEMEEKVELYLAKGAREVWIVREKGGTEFYSYDGRIEKNGEITI